MVNEYERLIADQPVSDNTYKYGDRDVTPQELYLCLMIEESIKQLDLDDVAAVAMIILGRPLVPTRGKFMFATKNTSVASVICRLLFDVKLSIRMPTITGATLGTLRISWTNNLGAFIGRKVPYMGWTIAVYDVIAINLKTMMRYNSLVRPEDKINDATSGHFG
ncbi:hypothetical protein PTKU46_40980 [Paraburkholderia terrae]|uniref:STM2901 family protein n=1 Tax=Paraburkholderia terrae TaxID=311230 RepID=UPI0030DFCEBA